MSVCTVKTRSQWAALQAEREAADSQTAELAAQLERLHKQAAVAADEASATLESARQKALADLQRAQVTCTAATAALRCKLQAGSAW